MRYLILASLLSLAACGPEIRVNAPPPPERYLTCEALPDVPSLARLEIIRAPDGALVYRKADVDARDGAIARYIVAVRGAWFSCHTQLNSVRDYVEGTK